MRLAETLAAYERGEINVLINAMLLAEGWNSPRATVCMHLAPTASKRVYQQRIGRIMRTHPRKEAGIVVDFVVKSATHSDRVVSLHSLLDADFYREGARVTPAPRRRVQRRARRQLSPAQLARPGHARRRPPARRDPARVAADRPEVHGRRRAALLGDDRRPPAPLRPARRLRQEVRREPGARRSRSSSSSSICAAENPNRRLRMTALQDRVSMLVERAEFDDLVTLVSQAPPWEKDRAAGSPDPAARDRRGQGERARPDPPALDVAARTGDAQDPGPPRERRVPGGEAAARRGRELARPSPRGERGPARAGRRQALPLEVGAALLASAEGYTPRASSAARPRPRGARRDAPPRSRTRSRTTCPRRRLPPASSGGGGSGRSAATGRASSRRSRTGRAVGERRNRGSRDRASRRRAPSSRRARGDDGAGVQRPGAASGGGGSANGGVARAPPRHRNP